MRAKDTVQVGADEETRKKQAHEAYAARNVNKNRRYVLVDDVWTTGSSMLAACETMQKAGVRRIDVVIIAKSG